MKGTRISVKFILNLLKSGMTVDEILQDYPHLTKEDIFACSKYATQTQPMEPVA